MGNTGCKICSPASDTRPEASMLTIWGDYINADTRAILSVLKISGQIYEYKNLNTLNNEHLSDKVFGEVNPSRELPVITD